MSNPTTDGPRAEYTRRAETKRAELAAISRTDENIGSGRLFAAILAIVGFIVASKYNLSVAVPIAPAIVFVLLVIWHERLRARRRLIERGVAFYDVCLARIDGKWAGTGNPGNEFLQAEHPYAADLDLFG